MPAAGLIRRPWWAAERVDRDLSRASAVIAAGQITVILSTAAAVWALAPLSWASLITAEQRTDATAPTVISIAVNNLLICCLPLLAGVYAHRLVRRGRRRLARVVVAVAGVGVTRSLLVIGLVGGLDPAWLACAAAWWVLEIAALSVCCAAGWMAFRDTDPAVVSRQLAHALVFAVAVLTVAAVVEVALT